MALRIFQNNPVGGKVFVIGIIVLALMIPLSMLKGLISERASLRDQAYRTVADGWGGALVTSGPMLRVPFDLNERHKDGDIQTVRHQLYVLPNTLSIEAKIEEESEPRHVGIYQVPVYQVRLKLRGSFSGKAVTEAAKYSGDYQWAQARLRLPLSDVRTVRELSSAHFASNQLSFTPGERGDYPGIEADVDLSQLLQEEKLEFDIDLKLAGSESFSLLPLAKVTDVSMQSRWPTPEFQGAFLPAAHAITDRGFTARWQVLELNRSLPQSWIGGAVDEKQLLGSAFGVGLFQSVDVYQRSERAVKYALMFIGITFLSFYAWEILSATAIHPMQYLFIGLAMSIFYLLLIALSEHLAFVLSYWIGVGALIALLGAYIAGALRSNRKGAIVSGIMTLVYGLLYVLVISESYALLMGAIALFAVLAVVMLATRNVKWYGPQS